jgi:hypothetical protein
VCSVIVIGVCVYFEDLFDSGWRETLKSDDEYVTVRLCVLFLAPLLLPVLLLLHEYRICPHGR